MTGKKMVFVILREQLGNQLFQWAAGFALSQRWRVPLKLFTHNYGRTGTYLFLRRFPVSAEFLNPWPGLLSRKLLGQEFYGFKRYESIVGDWIPAVESSPDLSAFRRLFQGPPVRTLLDGMFQSWTYFHEYRDAIRQELDLTGVMAEKHANSSWLSSVRSVESVSLHVRRTDYLVPGNRERFAVCTEDYFFRCIEECRRRLHEPVFFVFSDDIRWARTVFSGRNFQFVTDENFKRSNISDFVLMANCRHHIISNSSFSWWASYAGQDSGCVLMPDVWFNGDESSIELKRPPGWTTIPVMSEH